MIAFGCEDKNRSPIIEDRVCPKCGRDIEVFLTNPIQMCIRDRDLSAYRFPELIPDLLIIPVVSFALGTIDVGFPLSPVQTT